VSDARSPLPDLPDLPVQPSMRRMRRFGVRPDRELGQNFLIDSNILGVIERAAALEREDVVLEIGGGLGVLSEHLAARARHVHVIEIDTRLREPLADAVGRLENVTLHWGDAMRIELRSLEPAPSKLVANLPYGIAAGAILRTLEELASVSLCVAMVQREVGERLAASPGGGEYGVPSVLAQLDCDVSVVRAIPRTVFHPVPNVDSVLVSLRRRERRGTPGTPGAGAPAAGEESAARAGQDQALRALVAGSFAHRRKTLVGSLALSGGARGRSREQVRAALAALELPQDVRAERLSPEQFRALASELFEDGEERRR
jgi:16S rRNA (adenine1518-N6/adenine1519-N6)-dimethyltransferase